MSRKELLIILLFSLFFCQPVFAQKNHPLLIPFQDENGKFGYKNQKNKIVIQPVFEQVQPFDKNTAFVKQNGKWGLLNEKGLFIINPEYDTLSRFSESILAGKRQKLPVLPRIRFSEETYFGLLTVDNKILQEVRFKKIEENGKNQFELTSFNHWEIKKATGENVQTVEADKMEMDILPESMELDTIPLEYDWRMPYKLGRTWGFVDSIGLMRISNRYETVRPFHNKLAAVKFNGGWGFIDKYERIIIQPNYDWVSDTENGMIVANRNKSFGILSEKSKELTPFRYDTVFRHKTGIFIIEKSGKQGFSGKNGYEVVPPRFDRIFPQSDGNVIVQRANKFGLLSENGSILFSIQYDAIFFEPQEGNFVLMNIGSTIRSILSTQP